MGRAFLSARYNNDDAAALRSTTPMPAPAPPAVRRWDALANPFNPDDEVLDGQDMVFEAVVTPAPLGRTGAPRVRRMVLRPMLDVNDVISDSDSDSSSTTALLAPAEDSDVPVDDPIDAPTPAPPAATAEDPGDAAGRQLYVRMLDAIRPVFEANAGGSAETGGTSNANNPADASRRVEEHLRYVSSFFNPHTGRFDDNQFAQFVAPLISSELSMLSHAPALSQSV